MNQGIYRLIYNAAKGLVEVAGELACNGGKGGKINSPVPRALTQQRTGLCVSLKPLVFAGLVAAGQVWSPAVLAQIAVDGSVQQQTSVSTTANGIPQVNINAASNGGVSRNTFTQFDIDRQGVILNNAIRNTATQQAGFVAANPNLVGGQARVILNEVNSTQQSILNGFLEVAGQRADVIVANPAGITCSGCGFINVNRGTLTTGDPTFSNGELSGFRVNGGEITIGRDGLDGSGADFTDVIARSVKVNGAIVANTLGITTGRNQVSTDNTQHIALVDDGSDKPEFSIDVAALGGMYAGQIRLIGTEQGVGVRNAGSIGASAGEFTLSAGGGLVNTNSITSTGNTNIALQGDLDNQGTIHGTGNAMVNSAANVVNSGSLSSTGSFTLTAAGDISSLGDNVGIGAGIDEDSAVDASTSSTLTISAGGAINLQGNQTATQKIDLTAASITLESAEQQAESISLIATDNGDTALINNGTITLADSTFLIDNEITFTATEAVVLTNTESVSTQLTVTTKDLTIDTNSALAQVASDLSTTNSITNRGVINSQNTSTVSTQTLTNTGTGRLFADDIIIEANTLNNSASDGAAAAIAARNSLNIGVDTLSNSAGALLYSDGDLTIGGSIVNGQATGRANTITNDQARIDAAEDILITANTINNLNDDLVIGTEEVVETNQRAFQLFDSVNFIDGTLSNGGSLLNVAGGGNTSSFQTFTITRTTTRNVLGVSDTLAVITAEGNITLDSTATITNQNSQITAGGGVDIIGNNLVNTQVEGMERVSEQGTFTETVNGTTSGPFSFSGPANLARTQRRSETVSGNSTDENGNTGNSTDENGNATGNTTGNTTTRNFTVLITANSTDRLSDNDTPIRTTGSDLVTTPTLETGISRAGASSNAGTTIEDSTAAITAITLNDNGEVRVLNLTPTLPMNSLFNQNPAATAPFLIETDPGFTNGNNFLSSDFFLTLLGLDPADEQKRLGDGFFEQRLVRDQLVALTGQRFISGYSDNESQYLALLTNGAAFAEAYDLVPGVQLSAELIAMLTTDIVFLESQEITLADGTVQSVLVPRVYALVQKDDVTGGGNLVSGAEVVINSATVDNSGTIVGKAVDVTTATFADVNGRVQADNLEIIASDDIVLSDSDYRVSDSATLRALDITLKNTSSLTKTIREDTPKTELDEGVRASQIANQGKANIGSLVLDASRDLTVSNSQIINQGSGNTQLSAGNNLTMNTLKNTQEGSRVQGGGDVTLSAGDNITLKAATIAAGNELNVNAESITITTSEEKKTHRGLGTYSESTTQTGSQLTAGSHLTLDAEKELVISGSRLDASNDLSLNAGSITITSSEEKRLSLASSENSASRASSTLQTGSQLSAGNNTTLNAEDTLAIIGSRIDTGDDLNVDAKSIDISTSIDKSSNTDSSSTIYRGSELNAGNNATINAESTLAIAGSSLSTENDLSLNAQSIDITAKENRTSKTTRVATRGSSYTNEDGETFTSTITTTSRTTQTNQAGSQLSAGNNVALTANDTLAITASQVTAGQDANLVASDVIITAATNKATKNSSSSSRDFSNSSSETQTSSAITTGNNVTATATDDIAITGSDINANKSLNLTAGNDITIAAAESNAAANSQDGRIRRESKRLTNTTAKLKYRGTPAPKKP